MRSGGEGSKMKVMFFSQDCGKIEQVIVALRLGWPNLIPLIRSKESMSLQAWKREEPTLVIFCENSYDFNIAACLKEIRGFSDVPIVVTAENANESDVVDAFDFGADDFIRLPCHFLEFTARIVALLRRIGLTRGVITY